MALLKRSPCYLRLLAAPFIFLYAFICSPFLIFTVLFLRCTSGDLHPGDDDVNANRVAKKASQTAKSVALVRFFMYKVGWCSDSYAYIFAPMIGRIAAPLLVPLWWVTSSPPSPKEIFGMTIARTNFFDEQIEKALDELGNDASNLVIVGAGFDTRSFRLSVPDHVTIYEIDIGTTQAEKRRLTGHVQRTERVKFVAVDLSKESMTTALEQAGCNLQQGKFVFLWEGVSMYLAEEHVTKMLEMIATFPPGSRLFLDMLNDVYTTPERQATRGPKMRGVKALVNSATKRGEPMLWGLAPGQTVQDFVSPHGLKVDIAIDADEIEEQFLTFTDGGQLTRCLGIYNLVACHVPDVDTP